MKISKGIDQLAMICSTVLVRSVDLKVVRHQDTLWLGLNGQYEAIFPQEQ